MTGTDIYLAPPDVLIPGVYSARRLGGLPVTLAFARAAPFYGLRLQLLGVDVLDPPL
jgi:hypothetical protein